MLVSDVQQNDSYMHIYSIYCIYTAYTYIHIFIYIHVCMTVASVVSDFLGPRGLQPTRLLCLWDFPGKISGVSCHALLQGIFLTQGLNPHLLCLLCCRWILHPLSDTGKPSYTHTRTRTHRLLHILFHYRLLQDTEYSFLCYTVGPCWLSIFCIVILWPSHAKS